MYRALYLEINTICVCIIAVLLFRIRRNADRQTQNVLFSRAALSVLAVLLLDLGWAWVEGQHFAGARELNGVFSACYLAAAGLVGYQWLYYVECRFGCKMGRSRPLRLALLLPVVALLALCVSSFWTDAMFYIDADNVYHRGPLHFVQFAVAYAYLLAASIHVIVRLVREKRREEKHELALLLSFGALPAAGGVVSVLMYGLPCVWPAATVSLLLIFINVQSGQISRDSLTGLNNRRQFDYYLDQALSESARGERFALFMMDIDDFKHINDNRGHLSGDEALVRTARLLQGVCKSRDAFLARYGGDEFVIIYYCDGEPEAHALRREIMRTLSAGAKTSEDAPLMLSIGYALYDPAHPITGPELIAAADAALYEEKRTRKQPPPQRRSPHSSQRKE